MIEGNLSHPARALTREHATPLRQARVDELDQPDYDPIP